MASQIDIVNMALDHLNLTQKITAMNNPTEPARAAARWWDILRHELLQWRWDFSTRRVDLVVDNAAAHKSPSWLYAYTLPVDLFKAQGWLPWGFRNLPQEWEIPYEVASVDDGSVKMIYSDYFPSSLDKFVYTIDETDATKFPDHFVQALAAALAVKMAKPLRVHSDVFKEAVQIWMQAWNVARAAEESNRVSPPVEASWILARY